MKKLMYIFAVAATLAAAGCKKETIDPAQPTIAWESNPGFGQVELLNNLDAVVTASAPGKFQELKLTLNLGTFNILANPYISISANKGGSLNPVLDLIGDASCVSLANGLGMSVGQSLNNRTEVKLNLKAFLEKILQGQVVDNNTTLGIDIKVVDQNGKSAARTAKFHFTAAPVISWQKNPTFGVVDLDAPEMECKVSIWAPGKIAKLTVTLEDGAASSLTNYVKNRTSNSTTVIDLVEDDKVADSFKNWFPAKSAVIDKEQVTLDFAFLYPIKYDLEVSTNVFTVSVEDKNGKQTVQQVQFKKN